jgi:hypothetical protein
MFDDDIDGWLESVFSSTERRSKTRLPRGSDGPTQIRPTLLEPLCTRNQSRWDIDRRHRECRAERTLPMEWEWATGDLNE